MSSDQSTNALRAICTLDEADRLKRLPRLMCQWVAFRTAVYGGRPLSVDQEDEGRRCFLGGVIAMWNACGAMADLPDDEFEEIAVALSRELEQVPKLEFPEAIPPQFLPQRGH